MGYYDDVNKPTQFHMRLLSHADFDFTPFWEEAVVNWLHRNASRLLKTNPHCCKHFIGDNDQRTVIANHIPLSDDNDIIEFVRSLPPTDSETLDILAKRLIPAGKADLAVAKFGPFASMDSGEKEDPAQLIAALSDAAILLALTDLNWNECKWSHEGFVAFLRRLPADRLKDFPVERLQPHKIRHRRYGSEDRIIFKARNRTAVHLANTLPKGDLGDFIARFSTVSSMMDCMACGEMVAKSMPGYTLHRKVCDAENAWPNALVIAATRLV